MGSLRAEINHHRLHKSLPALEAVYIERAVKIALYGSCHHNHVVAECALVKFGLPASMTVYICAFRIIASTAVPDFDTYAAPLALQ